MSAEIYFVSGIDTGIGKTYVTGFLARYFAQQGYSVITQKLVQTGNVDISEDIVKHRQLMGIGLTVEDQERWTMPEVFSYPASPHLASEMDGRTINLDKIAQSTAMLALRYQKVLIEGAGGLMVPLRRDYLCVDYLCETNYPVILVSSGRLGSINHTLLSLEVIKQRGLRLAMLAYNLHHESEDRLISEDTAGYLKQYLAQHFPASTWMDIPVLA